MARCHVSSLLLLLFASLQNSECLGDLWEDGLELRDRGSLPHSVIGQELSDEPMNRPQVLRDINDDRHELSPKMPLVPVVLRAEHSGKLGRRDIAGGSHAGKPCPGTINCSRENLLEARKLVDERGLKVELELKSGNARTHSLPVLSVPRQKKPGTMVALLGSLERVQVGPDVVATYGPLRQFLYRKNMLSGHATSPNPRADRPLGFESEGVDKSSLTPDRGGGPLDDLFTHAEHNSAQTAMVVNAETANFGDDTADMVSDTRKTFWQRLTESWGARDLPTTQLAVAAKLGMSQGSVGRWARDEGLPEFDLTRRLAEMGDVCVEWLLTGRGPKRPVPIDEETNELLELWRRLNANGRHHVRLAAMGALAMQKAQPASPATISAERSSEAE